MLDEAAIAELTKTREEIAAALMKSEGLAASFQRSGRSPHRTHQQ